MRRLLSAGPVEGGDVSTPRAAGRDRVSGGREGYKVGRQGARADAEVLRRHLGVADEAPSVPGPIAVHLPPPRVVTSRGSPRSAPTPGPAGLPESTGS